MPTSKHLMCMSPAQTQRARPVPRPAKGHVVLPEGKILPATKGQHKHTQVQCTQAT